MLKKDPTYLIQELASVIVHESLLPIWELVGWEQALADLGTLNMLEDGKFWLIEFIRHACGVERYHLSWPLGSHANLRE